MNDLTIIFLTTNRVPKAWAEFHKEKLLEAADGSHIITISREPLDWGENILQTEPIKTSNIFWQLLKGVKVAKTPYIAVAEDDCLYTKEHFQYRKEAFCYNGNRWCLYTWNPVYHLKTWIRTNAVLIAPREMTLKALEERFAKYPHDAENLPKEMSGEIGFFEKDLGLSPQRHWDFRSETPVVQLDHDYFTGGRERPDAIERRHRKNYGAVKAYDIPVWGRAEDIIAKFK